MTSEEVRADIVEVLRAGDDPGESARVLFSDEEWEEIITEAGFPLAELDEFGNQIAPGG